MRRENPEARPDIAIYHPRGMSFEKAMMLDGDMGTTGPIEGMYDELVVVEPLSTYSEFNEPKWRMDEKRIDKGLAGGRV